MASAANDLPRVLELMAEDVVFLAAGRPGITLSLGRTLGAAR
jgi:ketosteroid isomerase-like protein